MRQKLLLSAVMLFPLTLLSIGSAGEPAPTPAPIAFKKTTLDKAFRSEGVAVADVNGDGKPDILVGDYWYEAPDWKRHEIRKPGNFGDGAGGYSQCFACWADDINKDGWPDLIVVGFPGAPCYWYENPGSGKFDKHWKQHEIWHSACNETPQYVDLFGTKQRVLVMGWQPKGKENEGKMAWFAPGADPKALWEPRPISDPTKTAPGTFKYYHGLGVGDINGDGRADVIIPAGWWEQPAEGAKATEPWKWHPAQLGDACADMIVYDIDGDNKADVISSSAHKYGIWAFLQRPGQDGHPQFVKKDLFPKLFSQSHALICADLDGDGVKDLITGKRRWAHGPKGDLDPQLPPVLYWFQGKKSADGVVTFTPFMIDDASGIGTQFEVADINGDGKLDIAVSNKMGVHIFEQIKK